MPELYALSKFMIQVLGPLMVVALVLMYFQVTRHTGRTPRLKEVIYMYVKYNLDKRRHAGLLTYLLILSALFFILSVLGLLAGSILK